jgi:hypothetical protein
MRTRSFARFAGTAVLALVATMLIAATVLTAWTSHVLLDEDRFSARVASTLNEDVVARYVGIELTNQIIRHAPDLITVRPAIETVAIEAVRPRTAGAGGHTPVHEAHRSIRAGVTDEALVLDLRAAFALADVLLEQSAPDVAARLPRGFDTSRIDASAVGLRADVIDPLERFSAMLPFLAIGSIAALAGLVWLHPSRRGGFLVIGVVLTAGGAAGLLGQRIAEEILLNRVPSPDEARPAVTLLWQHVLNDYRIWNLVLISTGLLTSVTAAASGRLPTPIELREALAVSPWSRAVGGALLAFGGIAVVRWPIEALTALAIAFGLFVAVIGLTLLLRSIIEGLIESRDWLHATARRSPQVLASMAAAIAMFALVLLLGGWFVQGLIGDEPEPPRPVLVTCNGHEDLCDRPLNEIVFAGTHNSMAAAAERGWYFPAHRYGIADQLRHGVRLLLIDTFYGDQTARGVRTVLDAGVRRDELVAEHGEEMVTAWERLSLRLLPGTDRGIYLCHSFCELGATPMRSALADIRDYLDAQPGEFVIIIVQDHTTPEDTVAEFVRAGLAERAYAHPRGEAWPTLGELLDRGKQLFVVAEEQAGAAPWYQYAWDFIEETPFDSTSIAAMSCRPNRGGTGKPLFLLNHWVSGQGPRPALALEANQYEVLIERVLDCQRERGRLVNFIAVDFYDAGDLFAVVDELNGIVEPEPRPSISSSSR